MAQKTIITTVALSVHNPEHDLPEIRDANGALVRIGSRGIGSAPPGTPVTLDADEADRILARWGGEEVLAEEDEIDVDDDADEDFDEDADGDIADTERAPEQASEQAPEQASEQASEQAAGSKSGRRAAR